MANNFLKNLIEKREQLNPVKNYMWYCMLPDLHVYDPYYPLHNDVEIYLNQIDYEIQDTVSSRFATITSPFRNFDTEQTFYGNSVWKYAKTNNIPDITLELLDGEDGLTFQYFNTWMHLLRNESDDTYNPPHVYKRNIKFYRINDAQEDIELIIYQGCFVSTINEITNDYESNELLKYQITLQSDNMFSLHFSNKDLIENNDVINKIEKNSGKSLLDNINDKLKSLVKDKRAVDQIDKLV